MTLSLFGAIVDAIQTPIINAFGTAICDAIVDAIQTAILNERPNQAPRPVTEFICAFTIH